MCLSHKENPLSKAQTPKQMILASNKPTGYPVATIGYCTIGYRLYSMTYDTLVRFWDKSLFRERSYHYLQRGGRTLS